MSTLINNLNEVGIDAYDNMYSCMFSLGIPLPLRELSDDDFDSVVIEIKISEFLKSTGNSKGYYGEHIFEAMDSWEDSFILDENILVVECCNYKGEPEGYTIYDVDMPKFNGKENSFNLANK